MREVLGSRLHRIDERSSETTPTAQLGSKPIDCAVSAMADDFLRGIPFRGRCAQLRAPPQDGIRRSTRRVAALAGPAERGLTRPEMQRPAALMSSGADKVGRQPPHRRRRLGSTGRTRKAGERRWGTRRVIAKRCRASDTIPCRAATPAKARTTECTVSSAASVPPEACCPAVRSRSLLT